MLALKYSRHALRFKYQRLINNASLRPASSYLLNSSNTGDSGASSSGSQPGNRNGASDDNGDSGDRKKPKKQPISKPKDKAGEQPTKLVPRFSRRLSTDKSDKQSELIVDRKDPPKEYPHLLAIPLTKRPLFPGFYKSIFIKEPQAVDAIRTLWEKRQPYIGIFLAKDDTQEKDLVRTLDDIEKVGVFAQITNVYPAGHDNSGLTVVVYPHRRIRATGMLYPPTIAKNDSTESLSESTEPQKADLDILEQNIPLAIVENLIEEPHSAENRVIKATANEVITVLKEISQLNPLLRY